MEEDIRFAKSCGAAGVVIGILHPDGKIDMPRMEALIALARPMEVTFHRAFDLSSDPYSALEDIISLGADRILTSGQKQNAIRGAELIHDLINQAKGRIIIMPGSGINENNIEEIARKTGASEFHGSLRSSFPAKMKFINTDVKMGSDLVNDHEIKMTDPERVSKLVEILQNISPE